MTANLLWVEGKNDQHVFYNLLKHHQIPEQFEIIDNILDDLPVQLKASELQRLGIVVDADLDIKPRWDALSRILTGAGQVALPSTPDPAGTIVEVEQADRVLTVGLWIMPDNQLPGLLEDFVSFLVPANDPLWGRAEDCVRHIPEKQRRFRDQHRVKAYLHTWLAWQKEPGKPMGQAITARYLDANLPPAHQLMSWVKQLFEL